MNLRTPATIACIALAALLCLAAAAAPPEHPAVSGLAPGIDLTSARALGWTPAQHETALRYSRSAWVLAFAAPLAQMASLGLLAFTGFAGRLESVLRSKVGWPLASNSAFIIGMVASLALLNFPLELYRFHREREYGFATQDWASWLADEMKGLIVVCLIALLFVLPIWGAIRRWPRRWWLIGSAISVAGSILILAVAPVFIAPLFNTFTPLSDRSLEERILALAHREGIPAENVYQMDASRQSRHDNAYVVGLLGTERIVLYDTLLAAYTPDEVEFVMGHEMGHYLLNHVWKGVAAASVAILTGFFLAHRLVARTIAKLKSGLGYDSVGSIAAVPLVLLFFAAYLFLIEPINSSVSRYFEHQADVFALKAISDNREVAVSTFQKMASRNLSDPNPPALIEWWIYSHPSMGNRIRFCAGRSRFGSPRPTAAPESPPAPDRSPRS